MDDDEYLCISIPTIKRNNLDSYEEIAMCESFNYGDLKYLRHQSQHHMIFLHLEVHRERRIDRTPEDETCNKVLRIPCNLSDLVESLSPSLPRDFFSPWIFHVILGCLRLIYIPIYNLSVDKFSRGICLYTYIPYSISSFICLLPD